MQDLTIKQAAADFLRKFYTEKKVREAYETWVAPDYIQHNPLVPNGREGAIAFLEPFFGAHPDSTFDVKRILVDGNFVTAHLHAKLFPNDRGMAVIDIFRVENGKFVEHWDAMQPIPETSANANGMF